MSCPRYELHARGELSDEAFAAHRERCAECRRAWEFDQWLTAEARRLPVPTRAPGLWARIAADLETASQRPPALLRVLEAPWADWLAAAGRALWRRPAWGLATLVLIAAAVGGPLLLRPAPPAPRSLLTEQALARVLDLEEEYAQAIEELEALAAPRLAGADTKILLRYRERLETIDAQIERCRAALVHDGANTYIRRCLLTAYRDKQETLSALLTLPEEPRARRQGREREA